MPSIAVVDDDADARDTLTSQIGRKLPDGWEVHGIFPLEDIQSYPSWIAEHNISVLLVDERLHVKPRQDGQASGYQGHSVVDLVRPRYPTLPIYVITAYPGDTALLERFAKADDIIDRTDFPYDADGYVTRFVRAGTKFYEENRQELELLADLSRKIAMGIASPAEMTEADGLRTKQALPLSVPIARSEWVNSLEQTVEEMKELEGRIRAFIESRANDEVA